VLKSLFYATGQFGKNHLGDRNEFLPCVHGFDEFLGNLYHPNAEEEPENRLSQVPKFREKFGPRGVLHCWTTDNDDSTLDPAQAIVARFLETFKEYPMRQKPASFNLDEVMRKLTPQ